MSQDQISVPLSKEQAYALVDAVMERDDLALTASAHEDESGEWVFEATCDSPPDIDSFNELARTVLGGDIEFSVAPVDPDVDWVGQSLAGLQPVVAGGFYVYGSHDTGPVPPGHIGMHIDAAQAFGTGHHETTTGCLEAIDKVLKYARPQSVLDVGTGTGVLALALAKRLRQAVVASDIDAIAVRTTRENARQNGVSRYIIAVEAAGLDHRAITENGPYDLIVANILAGPLAHMAPSIARAANKGGLVILSGILAHQANRIVAAYRQQGLVLKDKIQKKDWTTLTLERG